jgi:hypothetical protein
MMRRFQYDGVWWDARNAGAQWVGTLRFDGGHGAVLAVTVPTDEPDPFPPLQQYELIHGITTEGKAVTLIRCFDRFTRGSLSSAPRSVEIFANAVIVGFHCDRPDPLLSSAAASLRHMKEWWGRSGIQADESVRWPDLAVRYTSEPPLVVHDDGAFRVSIRSTPSGVFGRNKASLIEDVRLEIHATRPTGLSGFQRIVRAWRDFLSIACLSFCDTVELSLVSPLKEGGLGRGVFYAIPIYRDRERCVASASPFMLFRFKDIEQRAPEMLGGWLSQSEKLHQVRALYFSGVYGGGFIEGKFLALTQAAEAFHRRCYPGLYMDKARFETEVLEPLKAAIPMSVTHDLRESIGTRLHFANEYSQRRRFRILFAEHRDVLRVLVEDPEAYVAPIVNHRNEFTHFPPPQADATEAPRARDPERVLLYNWILRLLLESCFLRVMGFSEDEVRSLIEHSEMYRQVSALFREPRTT